MDSFTLLISIRAEDLAIFKYLLESYENLCQITTIDPERCLVELYSPVSNKRAIYEVLTGLKDDVPFEILSAFNLL